MNELTTVVIPATESAAELVAEVVPTLEPQAAADAANFAGMIAGDPEATNRYLDSLLRLLDVVHVPSVIEVVRACCN